MPVEPQALLRDLQPRVRLLEDDVRQRVEGPDGVDERSALVEEHRRAVESERTSATWLEFRDEQVTQAAVAWVLATVFTRFCEDNDLVPDAWIAGPGARLRLAAERQQAFLVSQPVLNDRDWLLAGFDHLASYPALAALLDHEHNPLHRLSISADAAEELLGFWRQTNDDGELVHDLTDPNLSTRFLGDLYQDLSETARTKYALLQTPQFVEEFILDQTLEPALRDRPLEGFRLIDPTCGSGHFLLGAFTRLLDRWAREAPALDPRERVQRALDAVHGVDLNPFAVAVARFRLTVAAMSASGERRLSKAPACRFHLAVGDSLLHGAGKQTLLENVDLVEFAYSAEDLAQVQEILRAGRYDVVVGNPPYITARDRALSNLYRDMYSTCKGKYALTVPFMQRFFELARSETRGSEAGWVGQITSNSFMKREFGTKLVEEYLPHRDLRLVVDTSGAYIPGHGTPTVIVVGQNRTPTSSSVRAVLGVRGEPGRPADAAQGLVWRSIVEHLDVAGWDDQWVTVLDLPRTTLDSHPWSLSGGGAVQLSRSINEVATRRLSAMAESIGITAFTLEDDVYVGSESAFRTRGIEDRHLLREMVLGDGVRDWRSEGQPLAIFPYDARFEPQTPVAGSGVDRWMWPFRTNLSKSKMFGGQTKIETGLHWTEYGRLTASKLRTPLTVTFAFVATHNHFVLDRGGKVFNRSAPVIKLPEGATEDDHLALLGVLNSSTACFWLKQNSHNKGSTVDSQGARQTQVAWENFYEFTGTTLKDFPLPGVLPLSRGQRLDFLATELARFSPDRAAKALVPVAAALADSRSRRDAVLHQMVSEQEELDWDVYRLYGLTDEALTYSGDDLPGLALGERTFEVLLARQAAQGESDTAWFERHGSTPITDLPELWPADYRALVERRLALIESDPAVRLLESPEHKRRWATEPWEKQEERALRGWLLDRLEAHDLWQDAASRPQTQSIAQLADRLSADADFLSVLELWSGHRAGEVQVELGRLLAEEHVPFLAALRYKAPGLRKREQWEHTWELQRAEDQGERAGDIPVPQKYTTADFVKTSYWKHRGKLDVPKERFISYPGAERGADQTLVLGWAGWDHAQQAQALASLAIARAQREGWEAPRLTPLLAGLAELEPWLHQWHGQTDPRMGVSPAQAMTSTLDRELARLGLTRADLRAWRPQPATRGRRPRTTQEA